MDDLLRDKIEVVLNEFFEHDNLKFRCVINLFGDCSRCDFRGKKVCDRMNCSNHLRSDHLPVMFIEESRAPDIPALVEDLKQATARYLEWTGKPTK